MNLISKTLLCFALVLTAILSAGAQGVLVSSPTGQEFLNTPPPGVEGFTFTTGSLPTTFNQVGVYDFGNDGLALSHTVSLFDSSGNLLASGTVAAGGTTTPDSFQWANLLTPVVLLPNSTYTLGASYDSNDPDHFLAGIATLPAGFTLGSAVYADQTGGTDANTYPNTVYVDPSIDGFFGPNLDFATVAVTGVPEASTWVISALAAVGLLVQVVKARSFSKRTH